MGPGRQGEGGFTALHWAAYKGRLEVVRLLLESGADRAAKDNKGATAYDCTNAYKHPAVATLLAEAPEPEPEPEEEMRYEYPPDMSSGDLFGGGDDY